MIVLGLNLFLSEYQTKTCVYKWVFSSCLDKNQCMGKFETDFEPRRIEFDFKKKWIYSCCGIASVCVYCQFICCMVSTVSMKNFVIKQWCWWGRPTEQRMELIRDSLQRRWVCAYFNNGYRLNRENNHCMRFIYHGFAAKLHFFVI